MRFLSKSASESWVGDNSAPNGPHRLQIHLPPESGRLLFISHVVAQGVTFRQRCLLNVTNWDIWDSKNNWHLYYRIRQSYGDPRMIDEAAGHLFLEHEVEDLITFLHIAMLFGWDADLRPSAPYIQGSLSHHGFLDLYADHPNNLSDLRETFVDAKLVEESPS